MHVCVFTVAKGSKRPSAHRLANGGTERGLSVDTKESLARAAHGRTPKTSCSLKQATRKRPHIVGPRLCQVSRISEPAETECRSGEGRRELGGGANGGEAPSWGWGSLLG